MAEKVGSVYIEIQAKMGSLEKELRELEAKLNAADKNGKNLTATFKDMAKGLGVAAAVYKIVGAYQEAIKYGSKLQETQNKFDVVFRNSKKEADAFAKTLVDSYGLATEESMAFLAGTGDILIGMGMASDSALELSNGVAQLGIDLASFTNVEGGAERAINALTSALTGEREALKAYGIVVSEELIKAELVANGKDKLTGMALNQAKAEATLAIAYRQSGNAIGDMARSYDSYANIQRRVDSQLVDFQAQVGTALIPAMSNLGLAFLSASKDGGFLGEAVLTITKYIAGTIDGISLLIAKLDTLSSKSGLDKANADAKTLLDYNKNLVKQYGGLAEFKAKATAEEKAQFDANMSAAKRNISLAQEEGEVFKKKNDALANIQDRIANSDKVLDANKAAIANREKDRSNEKINSGVKETAENKKQREQQLKDIQEYGSLEMAEFVKNLEEKAQKYQQYTGVLTNMSGSLSQLSQMAASNQTAEVDNRMQKELGAIESRYNREAELIQNSLLTEEEKNAQLKVLDENRAREEKAAQDKAAKEKRKIAHEAAKQQKMLAMFDTIIATPTAAFQAYKALAGIPIVGPALGAAAAAATTALGLAKLKLIKDQPLPALAEGGIVPAVPGGNQFTIGEAGSAEAVIPLNDSTLSRLAGMINNAGGGGQSYAKLPPMSDTAVFNMIWSASQNGDLYIDSRAVVNR